MLKYASMSAVGVASYTAHLWRLTPPIGRIMGLPANPHEIAEIKELPAGWREAAEVAKRNATLRPRLHCRTHVSKHAPGGANSGPDLQ